MSSTLEEGAARVIFEYRETVTGADMDVYSTFTTSLVDAVCVAGATETSCGGMEYHGDST